MTAGLCVLAGSDALRDGLVVRTVRREAGQQAAEGTGVPLCPPVWTLGCCFQAEECVEFSITCGCEAWTRSQELLGGRPDPQPCQRLACSVTMTTTDQIRQWSVADRATARALSGGRAGVWRCGTGFRLFHFHICVSVATAIQQNLD